MVKISELPLPKPRLDFKDMPPELELLATGEELREATKEKTGGLIITYKTRKGEELKQKYGKLANEALVIAMQDLGLKDTVELQKAWYNYKMTSFRTGFPRYIPTKKAR